ncbi:MAG: ubiquinol-cytochrome C chaperone family protein [Rhodospirillales bacterium]|nr:ubiquinol-cytochrome C chaperone family protein [Rhodospirillales bacterium]
MRVPRIFSKRIADDPVQTLYSAIVCQARQPAFYRVCGVADTPDGRFDLIALHAALILRRLRMEGEAARPLAQALFDHMFADMDENLREMGVGDLGVGKRVKAMARAFYGRLAAYDAAVTASDRTRAAEALRRNLYRKSTPSPDQVESMADYLFAEAARLDTLAFDRMRVGIVAFGPPPQPGSG